LPYERKQAGVRKFKALYEPPVTARVLCEGQGKRCLLNSYHDDVDTAITFAAEVYTGWTDCKVALFWPVRMLPFSQATIEMDLRQWEKNKILPHGPVKVRTVFESGREHGYTTFAWGLARRDGGWKRAVRLREMQVTDFAYHVGASYGVSCFLENIATVGAKIRRNGAQMMVFNYI
jgi:hypothetical protein